PGAGSRSRTASLRRSSAARPAPRTRDTHRSSARRGRAARPPAPQTLRAAPAGRRRRRPARRRSRPSPPRSRSPSRRLPRRSPAGGARSGRGRGQGLRRGRRSTRRRRRQPRRPGGSATTRTPAPRRSWPPPGRPGSRSRTSAGRRPPRDHAAEDTGPAGPRRAHGTSPRGCLFTRARPYERYSRDRGYERMSPLSGHGGSWLRGGQRRLRRAARAAHAAAGLGRLCASPLGRLKVFAAAASVAAGRRVPGWPAEAELPLRLGSRSHPVVVGDLSELEALYEVLVEDEYRLPPALDPRVVLDLGSHVGASVIALKLTYPSARVIAVEPDPHSFARLTRNVSSLEGVTCLNVAAGAQPGRRRLFRQEGSSWSSSLLAEQNLDCAEEVEVWSLAQILARADVEAVELV